MNAAVSATVVRGGITRHLNQDRAHASERPLARARSPEGARMGSLVTSADDSGEVVAGVRTWHLADGGYLAHVGFHTPTARSARWGLA
jgi:hypothetical protein